MARIENQIAELVKRNFGGVPNSRFSRKVIGGSVSGNTHPTVIRKVPVVWGIPCDEVMYARFFTVFMENANIMPWDGTCFSEGTYLPEARNFIHNTYLKDSNLPYLMMLDSDIMFPPNIVEMLMAHKLPIVGGWYRNKGTKFPVVYNFVSEDENGVAHWRHRDVPGEGLEKVDAMGAGCFLMKREVAEKLGENPYNMNSGGEDMTLCRKLMKLNIPLHVDWSINLAHIGVFHV